jgi:hypothetical protein
MRKPSRLMPRWNPPKTSPIGRFLLFFFLALLVYFVYLSFSSHPFLSSLGLSFILFSTGLSHFRSQRKLRRWAKERGGESLCNFAREFNTREVDTWVIRAVYEQIQEYLKPLYPQFPIRASDPLLYGLIEDSDDLDLSLALEIAERTGRSLEEGLSENPYAQKVFTVRDLVLFFNAQPYKRDEFSQ